MSQRREVKVPDVGEGTAEVEVVKWLVNVGDTVDQDDPLATVETDKAQVDIPAPHRGMVLELGGQPGDILAVGSVLVVLTQEAASEAPMAEAQGGRSATKGLSSRKEASPAVRHLARVRGVDLETLEGTGPGERVMAHDVERAATMQAAPGHIGGHKKLPLRGVRREMARHMTDVAKIPHVTGHKEVEVRRLVDWRSRVNPARHGAPPMKLTPFLALMVIHALRDVPALNATFDPQHAEITLHPSIHLALAVATEDGLVVPVIHDAAGLSLDALNSKIERLTEAARRRNLTPSDMQGGTFTITNYGSQGGWFGTPLLHAPQVGIVGFGRIERRPWVIDDEIVVAPILPISVSIDHRVIDGETHTQFLEKLASLLHEPEPVSDSSLPDPTESQED